MEIINKSESWVNFYNAYDLQVICKTGVYVSSVFGYEEDVITHIAIINPETKEVLYKDCLGNKFASMKNVVKYIDELLYYLSSEKLDSYDIEKLIDKVVRDNNYTLFVHNIQQRIKKETEEKETLKRVINQAAQYEEVKNFCKAHNITIHRYDSTFYFITFNSKENAENWDSVTKDVKDNIINNSAFMIRLGINIIYKKEYSAWYYNKIFAYGELTEVIDRLKEIIGDKI